MSESKGSPIVRDLVRIHSIITRGLNVLIEKSESLAERGYPDASTREGFMSYARTFASVLDGHHIPSPIVKMAHAVTGRFDVVLQIEADAADSVTDIGKLVNEKVSRIQGIRATETLLVV